MAETERRIYFVFCKNPSESSVLHKLSENILKGGSFVADKF